MSNTNNIPAPQATAETGPFWAAAAEGRLLLRRCRDCSAVHYYPRPNCPFCGGETDWVESSGRGEVYSYSLMLRADPPYVIAFVRLEEGIAMMTNIVDCEPSAIVIGMKVKVVYRPTSDGAPVPMFAPI
ncbi:Zn-ribbon domain-containing OB-fold protein [Comamonadaceae bacterium G21597-S1]|nr:Zn-ribbon domain-containing OB-fold protein [Comamonadaceae bacterium G21597-S1]